MLTLIIGRGKSGKTTRLLQAVKDCPATGMAQRILIVPEQLSHQTERMLGTACGAGISYVSEVLSFTRLQNRVSSIYGGEARKALDKGGRILTARLALSSIFSQLKVFASAAGRSDFLGSMVTMIDEFKSYDVGAKQLLDAASEGTGLFAQKLHELGLILGAYDAVMARGCCDPRDKLTLLRNQLLETDYAAKRHFFVDGFTDFSAQELGVLEALLRQSGNVTITVPCDGTAGKDPFGPGAETVARLIRMARSAGQMVQTICTNYVRPLPETLTYLERNLFSYEAPAYSGACTEIEIVAAGERLDECRHCAAELRRQAMSGMRWRDMAVAVGNMDAYGPVMEAICRDYGVPLYTGTKTPVTAHPAIATLLCALEAATEGMTTETVTAYLKAGYSGVSSDECDALENYAYTWSVRGKKWQKPWTEHPDGYDGRFTEGTQVELDRLNMLRQQAVEPLMQLSAGLKNAGNTRAQIMAVYRFLEDTKLFVQVNDQVERLAETGELEAAQETAQIWNTLIACLQQVVNVLGETAQNGSEFSKILRLALEQYEIGTIPAVLDAVHFGSLEEIRGIEPKVLFVLGANEGSVPSKTFGNSLLTERERGILQNQMNIQLAPDDEGTMERQMFQIYSALTSPAEHLYMSYALSAAGEQLRPSFLIGRLQKLFPAIEVQNIRYSPLDAMTPETMAEVYFDGENSGQNGLRESIRRAAGQLPELEQAIVDAKAASLPRSIQVPRKLSERLFGAPVKLTASKLDQLGNCPLSFFLNYGLKARLRKEASFDAAEFGTFLHYILEKTVGEITASGCPLPLEQTESSQLVEKYMAPYLEERLQTTEELSSQQQYLYTRNSQEASALLTEISQELSASEFRPCAFELQFGKDGGLEALEVSGASGQGKLDGMVDRVDLWKGQDGDYFCIIDYKSGNKTFDYTDLYGNVGMQMLLYMFALEKSGIPGAAERPIPAGALYVPAKQSILSAEEPPSAEEAEKLRRKSGSKRTGVVLADENVLEAMEHGGGGKYVPIQKKKDGMGDFALTSQQMKILKDFVQRRMAGAVDQIYAGQFEANPFYRGQSHDPCQWCDYEEVCQKDKLFRREHYHPTLNAKEFWTLIGGETDG